MMTGSFENFSGTIAEIGALYPFEGTESFLVTAGVIFWLWWQIKQTRRETTELQETVRKYGDNISLKKHVVLEDPEHP